MYGENRTTKAEVLRVLKSDGYIIVRLGQHRWLPELFDLEDEVIPAYINAINACLQLCDIRREVRSPDGTLTQTYQLTTFQPGERQVTEETETYETEPVEMAADTMTGDAAEAPEAVA